MERLEELAEVGDGERRAEPVDPADEVREMGLKRTLLTSKGEYTKRPREDREEEPDELREGIWK